MIKRNKIKSLLLRIGAIDERNLEIFSSKTRDNDSLMVYRDRVSGVIFIDDYYIGTDVYQKSTHKSSEPLPLTKNYLSYEDICDTNRRIKKYLPFIANKSILDFGCGHGSFLKDAIKYSNSTYGIELNETSSKELKEMGICCHHSISNISCDFDTAFMFHCLEHLPDPSLTLKQIHQKLKSKGYIIIEVPHARDFLINNLSLQSFIDFTLWSQHLVLHTRDSLHRLLVDAGFRNITIEGIQRYNLANHMHWLSSNQPGGHKEILSAFMTDDLCRAYHLALSKIDACDTLVAIASK